jgi:hypothetical protein
MPLFDFNFRRSRIARKAVACVVLARTKQKRKTEIERTTDRLICANVQIEAQDLGQGRTKHNASGTQERRESQQKKEEGEEKGKPELEQSTASVAGLAAGLDVALAAA